MANEAKHTPTPGPWTVRAVGTTQDESGERLVAEVSAGHELIVDATYIEDARFIAAAPDLYDAADAALNALIGCCIAGDGVDDRKTMLEAQQMLRAAIAKATGVQQ